MIPWGGGGTALGEPWLPKSSDSGGRAGVAPSAGRSAGGGAAGRRRRGRRRGGGPWRASPAPRLEPGLREEVRLQGPQVDLLDEDEGRVALLDLVEDPDLLRVPDVRLLRRRVDLLPARLVGRAH